MRNCKLVITICLLVIFMLVCAQAQEPKKTRVYVIDSTSWSMSGASGAGTTNGSFGGGGSLSGGARPQTAEIIKTFNDNCPQVTITSKKENADFLIHLDHEGGKWIALRDNKVVVFNRDGDAIYSGSTRSLGNAVKDACQAILKQ